MSMSKHQPGETLPFQSEVVLLCLCGGKMVAGYTDGEPGAIHTTPVCAKFESLEPDEFLKWLRTELERVS